MATYRVFISTDLGGDPDDIQSLVHLLHYSDILKIEGLISTTGPESTPNADLVSEWVKRVDLDYLRPRGNPKLMGESEVVSVVKQGATWAGAPRSGADTPGSRWLVERANAPAEVCQSTINKWRVAYLSDWKQRWLRYE